MEPGRKVLRAMEILEINFCVDIFRIDPLGQQDIISIMDHLDITTEITNSI